MVGGQRYKTSGLTISGPLFEEPFASDSSGTSSTVRSKFLERRLIGSDYGAS